MTGDDIVEDVQAVLVDSGVHWSEANLLLWINEGGREIATLKPKATTVRENVTLTANTTKQSNPAGVLAVLELYANMGADGATPGRHITTIPIERLAAVRPSWRSETGAAVKHFAQDDRDPAGFYVWPGPTSAMKVEALVHKTFAEIGALDATIPLDASYRTALTDYVLHRAYAMEGESQSAGLAATYYGKFAAGLGIQIRQQKRASAPANSAESPAHPVVDKNGA